MTVCSWVRPSLSSDSDALHRRRGFPVVNKERSTATGCSSVRPNFSRSSAGVVASFGSPADSEARSETQAGAGAESKKSSTAGQMSARPVSAWSGRGAAGFRIYTIPRETQGTVASHVAVRILQQPGAEVAGFRVGVRHVAEQASSLHTYLPAMVFFQGSQSTNRFVRRTHSRERAHGLYEGLLQGFVGQLSDYGAQADDHFLGELVLTPTSSAMQAAASRRRG